MKRRIQIFDKDEFNYLLERARRLSFMVEGKYEKGVSLTLSDFSYLHIGDKNCELTTLWGSNMMPTTYYFTLDGKEKPLRQGSECYAIFRRSCGEYLPSYREDELAKKQIGFFENKFANRQAGYLYFNEKYNNKKTFVYGYDINSAYLSAIYDFIPDTRQYKGFDRVLGDNEIGFIFDDELTLIEEKGVYCDVIFDLIESPKCIKNYCDRWYSRKQNKDKEAKQQIVNAIGYLQYHNPYLRAYIVSKCNRVIKKLKDEDTVLCNTDAIYSTKKLDVEIGEKLGQFKFDCGYIEINGLDYKSEVFGDRERGIVKNLKYKYEGGKIIEI